MKQSEIIKFLLERYPEKKYIIGAVRQISGRSYVTVTDKSTKEQIRVEINGSQIIERGEGYTTKQFDDNDGKIRVDENGNVIEDDTKNFNLDEPR